MIHVQQSRAAGCVPATEAKLDVDTAGSWHCSVYRYGGIVVLGPDQYERLGDGIEFWLSSETAEA